MESEEAILENENNCNVESESNTRDRDYCTSSPVSATHGSPGLSPKVAPPHLGSVTDVSQVPDSRGSPGLSPKVAPPHLGSVIDVSQVPDSRGSPGTPCLSPADVTDNEDEPDLGSGADEILGSRVIDQTTVQDDKSYSNHNLHYEAVKPAGLAQDSGVGGKDIQDYEDFLPEDEPSQQGAAEGGGAALNAGGSYQMQDGATENSDQLLDNEDDSEHRLQMGEVENDESSRMDDDDGDDEDETSRMDDGVDDGVAESNEMDVDDSMGEPPARGDDQVTELELSENSTQRSGVTEESAAGLSEAGLKQSSSSSVDVHAGRFWEDDVDLLDVDSQGEAAGMSVVDDLTRQASHNMTGQETSDVPDTKAPTTETVGSTGADLNDATDVLEDKEDDDLSQSSQLHAAGITGDEDEDGEDRSQPRPASSPGEEDGEHVATPDNASNDSVADSKMSPQANDNEDVLHDTENLDDILSLDDCLQETDRSLDDHSQDAADKALDDHSQDADDKALDDHSQDADDKALDDHSQDADVALDDHSQDADKAFDDHSQDADDKALDDHSQDADDKALDDHSQDADDKALDDHSQDADDKALDDHSQDADDKALDDYSQDADVALDDHSQGTDNAEGEDSLVSGTSVDLEGEIGTSNIAESDNTSQETDSEHGNSHEFVSQSAENESVVGAGLVPASIAHGGQREDDDDDDKVLSRGDAGQHVGQADESVLDCADNDGQDDDDGSSPGKEDYQDNDGAVELEGNGGDGQEIDGAVKCEESGEGDGQVDEDSLAKESNLEATSESVADVCAASNSSEPEPRESPADDEHIESDQLNELEHQETEHQEGEEQEPETKRIDHHEVEPEQISHDQESGQEDVIGQEIDYQRSEQQQQKDYQVNDGEECEQNKAVEEKVECEDGGGQVDDDDDDGSVEEKSRLVGDDHVAAGEKMDVTEDVDKTAVSADSAAPCDDGMDVDGSPQGPCSTDREVQQNSVDEGDRCEEEEAQDDGNEEEDLVKRGQEDTSKIDSVGSELGHKSDDDDERDMAELGDNDDTDEPIEGEQEDKSKTDSVRSEMGHEHLSKTDNAISEVVDNSKTDKIVSDMEQESSMKKDGAISEVVRDDSLETNNAAHEMEQEDSLKKDNAVSSDVQDSSNKDEAEAGEAPKIKSERKPSTDSYFTRAAAAAASSSSSSGGDVKEEAGTASKAGDVDDDLVVIDDEGKVVPVQAEAGEVKVAENGLDVKATPDKRHHHAAGTKKSLAAGQSAENNKTRSSRPSRSKLQTCLVCQKICKCKYNIVRNGDTKHLCDDACFQQFRKTPSVFLKGGEESKSTKPVKEKDPPATRRESTPASARKESTPAVTRKESTPASARRESTPASARKESTPSSARKESLPASRVETQPVPQINPYRTCAICQLMNVNTSQPFCNWKGLDFCGESCLGKFQASLNTSCSFCHAYIPIDMRATCCLKIGNDMRPFCKQRCYNEFKKKLRMCSFCQRDIAGVSGAFTTMVGTGGKFREFCSQACMKKLENRLHQFEILYVDKGNLKPEVTACSVCDRQAAIKCAARVQGKVSKLCSDICLSTFVYSSKLELDKCDQCGFMRSQEEAQAHFVQYEGQVKSFCSDNCVSVFRKARSQVLQCDWCDSKKLNFDMIERLDVMENKCQMFCSPNCLSLFRVNQQARSSQPVPCDLCQKIAPAQYHLTMSDASVRNFCSCNCVMTFRSQFANKQTPSGPGLPGSSMLPPSAQLQNTPSTRGGRGRMHTRQAKHQTTVPVISNVVSLAHPVDAAHSQTPPAALPAASPATLPGTLTPLGSVCPSADGKHQILIQAATPKSGKNKSLQCKPLVQTKATSCKPHSQTRETQTDEVPVKNVLIPVPVPVYVPMPSVMYTAPAPKLMAIPIPIPIPIFIPTTRKSANGILKAIQEIVERMPADPLEAELLMMAEAVASDKRPGDSDTDSEDDDFSVPVEDVLRPATQEDDSMMMRKREGGGQGEEDMIQMALRMAEEMSGPIEDLETSVEPVAVSAEAPAVQHHETIQAYDSQVDDEYIPARSYPNRGAKRPSRGRTPTSRVKKPRPEKSYEDDSINSTPVPLPHSNEPPPDANYRLKFTYGVNAWQHWVLSKNSQIEKSRHITGGNRLRTFSTDILKCTVDELNISLCMFIKEVRKPNGEAYSPDSIYYLCLGIQQYLYENARIDNIFTDSYFEKFTDCLNEILKSLQPKVNNQGQMLCRIEEEHLWESKQLGAHSPFILLNTLIYFHTKHFILKSAQEHLALSFAQILKHWKKGVPIKGQGNAAGKNVSLRFYCLANGKKDGLAARRNKDGTPVYEVTENFENPLRCPVKLYEFFLSKCPESIKNRNDIFYPVPERSCVPDSPVWYSTQSIDTHTMDKMLTRLLLVREIQEAHLHAQPVYL